MKKVNWLIEQNIYDRETEFLAELQKQGCKDSGQGVLTRMILEGDY
jgi:hypothetical protein